MASEFVVRKGLIILDVPTGTTSNQFVTYNSSTGKLERKTQNLVSGSVSAVSFAGNSKIYNVFFDVAFPSSNYSPVITGGDARSLTVENITASGFTINSNSNTSLSNTTFWIAVLNT